MNPSGPFETLEQARQTPAVQAVYDTFRAEPGAGQMAPGNAGMITTACAAAGVDLGAYDARIVAWLGGWEPETCAVIAGLITRAATA